MSLVKILLVIFFLTDSAALYGMPYPETVPPQTYGLHLSFLELEQADHDYEKRLSMNLSYSRLVFNSWSAVIQLQLAPDFSKDTSDLSVYQNLYSASAMIEYSYIYLFRFFVNLGPQLTYQRIQYSFRGDERSLTDTGTGLTTNFGFEYAITPKILVTYSTGWQWRYEDDRMDKIQNLGVGLSL